MPKFGMKVPHLRCDSHTSFKVKRSKVRVTDGRGHNVSAEPGGNTACYCRHATFKQCKVSILLVTAPLLVPQSNK